MGKRIDVAKDRFWSGLADEIKEYEIKEYEIAPVTTVEKLLTFCKYAAYNKAKMYMKQDCRIMRLEVDKPSANIIDNVGNCGFFYECTIKRIEEILPICSWELQTLSYIGLSKDMIKEFVFSYTPQGIDRIVHVGKTMDFSFEWDGKDIIREMTRKISLS